MIIKIKTIIKTTTMVNNKGENNYGYDSELESKSEEVSPVMIITSESRFSIFSSMTESTNFISHDVLNEIFLIGGNRNITLLCPFTFSSITYLLLLYLDLIRFTIPINRILIIMG